MTKPRGKSEIAEDSLKLLAFGVLALFAGIAGAIAAGTWLGGAWAFPGAAASIMTVTVVAMLSVGGRS